MVDGNSTRNIPKDQMVSTPNTESNEEKEDEEEEKLLLDNWIQND